jgi:hypothetical protein
LTVAPPSSPAAAQRCAEGAGLDGDEHGRSTISRAVHRARSCSRSQFPPVLGRPMSASDTPRIYTRLTDATSAASSIGFRD